MYILVLTVVRRMTKSSTLGAWTFSSAPTVEGSMPETVEIPCPNHTDSVSSRDAPWCVFKSCRTQIFKTSPSNLLYLKMQLIY